MVARDSAGHTLSTPAWSVVLEYELAIQEGYVSLHHHHRLQDLGGIGGGMQVSSAEGEALHYSGDLQCYPSGYRCSQIQEAPRGADSSRGRTRCSCLWTTRPPGPRRQEEGCTEGQEQGHKEGRKCPAVHWVCQGHTRRRPDLLWLQQQGGDLQAKGLQVPALLRPVLWKPPHVSVRSRDQGHSWKALTGPW